MPEGHISHRNAILLTRALVGQVIERVDEGPRVAAQRLATRLTGRTVTRVEAVGKHHLLHFDDGSTLHSHLGMVGRWWVQPRDRPLRRSGLWLALETATTVAAQYRGPTLRLYPAGTPIPAVNRVGPDLLDADGQPDPSTRIRVATVAPDRTIGDVLLDQRVVSGIGNIFRSEALWDVGVSPWTPVGDLSQDTLDAITASAARQLSAAMNLAGLPRHHPSLRHAVYNRAGRPCPRCGTSIRARGHGDENRTVYWCPTCQGGAAPRTHSG